MWYEDFVKTNKDIFLQKVKEISSLLGINPNWLMFVMRWESSLNPAAVNPISGATGLIQFLPSTAKSLGTSTTALKNMSNIDQLDYVVFFFLILFFFLQLPEDFSAVLINHPYQKRCV